MLTKASKNYTFLQKTKDMSRLGYQTGRPQTLCPDWIVVWLLKSVVRAGELRKLQGQPSHKSPMNADKLPIVLDGFKVKMSWYLELQKVDLRLERRDDLQMKSMVKGSSKPQIPVSIQLSLLAMCTSHLVAQGHLAPSLLSHTADVAWHLRFSCTMSVQCARRPAEDGRITWDQLHAEVS